MIAAPRHLYQFTPFTLTRYLAQAGFKVEWVRLRPEVNRFSMSNCRARCRCSESFIRSTNASWPPATAQPGKLLANPELVAV